MEDRILVREAVASDKTAFMELWEVCFGDSQNFMDWMFANRFYPENSLCLLEGDEMCSAMQGVPYEISIRGKSAKGMMLCGVSTHPKHRKRGFMGRIFSKEMQMLRDQGYVLAVHTPAVLESYFSFGHYPVADALYVTGRAEMECKATYTVLEKKEIERLYSLYCQEIGAVYSGSILRTKGEFLRKYDDYAADGGKCIVIGNEEILGYAMLYEMDAEVVAVEMVAKQGAYDALLCAISDIADGRKINCKLPPDVSLAKELPNGLSLEQKQKGVAGVCNIAKLLEIVDVDCPYTVEVTDAVVRENNGIFDFLGNVSDRKPACKVEAGRLLGVLLGYVSLDEIKEYCTIYRKEEVAEIANLLPKYKCYIIDEY